MLSYKLILQSLITVPKNLQIYTAATFNRSKLNGHRRENLYNEPSVENCKNGTINNIFNDTGVDGTNEINVKYSSYSLPSDVYKKIRKVNHNSQITKISHQRSKTNFSHLKSRNIHQDTRKNLVVRNSNRITKHRSQVSQNTLRYVSNRSGILPLPSSNKNIDVPANLDENSNNKLNFKYNKSTIPPPTSCNENLIHDNPSEEQLKSSINITMSKGRKLRPPSGTEKLYTNSGRISKASSVRKYADFGLLKNKESLLKFLKNFIHTTQPLTDVDKSKSFVNWNNISNETSEETSQQEIYYKQHFPNQFYSYECYKSNDDKINDGRIRDSRKKRRFKKSYLRPVNLPPPTPKKSNLPVSNLSLPSEYTLEGSPSTSIKQSTNSTLLDFLQTKKAEKKSLEQNFNFSTSMGTQNVNMKSYLRPMYLPPPTPKKIKMHTSNSSLLPVYGFQKMKDLSCTFVKQETKPPYLLHLLQEAAKRAAQKAQHENHPLPVNLNSYSSTVMPDAFDCQGIQQKAIYENMQENAWNDCMNYNKQYQNYMMNDKMSNENHYSYQHIFNGYNNYNNNTNFESNNTINTAVNDDYTVNMEKNNFVGNSLNNYYKDSDYLSMTLNSVANISNKNTENQENKTYTETSNTNNTFTSPETMNSNSDLCGSEERQENNLNTQASSIDSNYLEKTWSKNNSLCKNNGTIQFKIYSPVSDIPKTLNKQVMNKNMHQVDENQENKYDCETFNLNYKMFPERDDSDVIEVHINQENNANSQTLSNMNALPTEKSDSNVHKMDASNAHLQTSNMNYTFSEKTDSYIHKMGKNQENKFNFQAFNMSNALPTKTSDANINKMDGNKVNMNNTLSESSDSSVHEMDENQENKMNLNKMDNARMSTVEINSNNNTESTESNNMSKIKESLNNAYLKSLKLINSDIPESFNNNFHKYYGSETNENKVDMQASREIKNTMAATTNNLSKTEQNQGIIEYFDEINKIDMSLYDNEANQITNENIMPSSMNTGMKNKSKIDTTLNFLSMINRSRKTGVRKSEKNPKSLIELVKSFNHASIFVPKQNLWKKFKFPPPSPSAYQTKTNNKFKSKEKENKIPKFKSFLDARCYFVQPENLKKLSPAQIAMFNSIIYYENVIKKHSDEIKRQRNNLESTQQALKIRKHKYYKNNSVFHE